MEQKRYRRKTKVLWVMILLAIVYSGLIVSLFSSTGYDRLAGIIGVLLGLYICSHPAANAVDVLIFERGAVRQLSKNRSGIGWLALNFLVLFVGWIVIVIGTTRLTARIV